MVESDLLIGKTLQGIHAIAETEFNLNEACYALVELVFQDYTIVLKPIADSDEIEFTQISTTDPIKLVAPNWATNLLQQKLQTFWLSENAQGYQDQVTFAFGQLQPNLMFIAEGSAIKVFQCLPVPTRSVATATPSNSVLASANSN
jgi:hypothetical protein